VTSKGFSFSVYNLFKPSTIVTTFTCGLIIDFDLNQGVFAVTCGLVTTAKVHPANQQFYINEKYHHE
jgi:hypothetical protein